MRLDVRLPIGMLFSIFGILLALFGAFSDPALYERSLGINVNLIWGIVLLGFGVVMLFLGRRGVTALRPDEVANEPAPPPKRGH